MLVSAAKYKELFKVRPVAGVDKLEYEGKGIVVRTSSLKVSGAGGCVRLYLNGKGEQVLTGRRFDPLPSGLLLLKPGAFYKVYTNIEIVEPLPLGMRVKLKMNDDLSDVMFSPECEFLEGESGIVSFVIQAFRRIELQVGTSLGSLMVFEDFSFSESITGTVEHIDFETVEITPIIGDAPETVDSDREEISEENDSEDVKVIPKDASKSESKPVSTGKTKNKSTSKSKSTTAKSKS
jgi:hypothetical protein